MQLVHQLLSFYGTGADQHAIQNAWDHNASYQLPAQPSHSDVVKELDLSDPDHAQRYLGKGKHYPDFLAYFQREVDAKGWEAVLAERFFAGTEAADDLLVRLYAGFLHPLIQLMYGMEWKQPAIASVDSFFFFGSLETLRHPVQY